MTLVELSEPLLQYVCRLNRAGRKGGRFDFIPIRDEVRSLFEAMRAKSAGEFRLAKQFEQVELPLIFFTDSLIAESKLPCAGEWDKKRLAYERRELAGDEKFYDLLEETMKDPSDEATERLTVFYTCIGLGFMGWYQMQPEYLRKKMLEIGSRIRKYLEADATVRICPENYEGIDTRDLIEPPGSRLWLMVAIFAICAVTALACNIYLFFKAYGTLNESLAEILRQGKNLGL